jgi:hypothetical protein
VPSRTLHLEEHKVSHESRLLHGTVWTGHSPELCTRREVGLMSSLKALDTLWRPRVQLRCVELMPHHSLYLDALLLLANQAFTFVREFVLGNNKTGLVTESSSGCVSVVGGEDSTLAGDVLAESPDIYLGSVVTTSTYRYPSQTIAKFSSYLATATASSYSHGP